MTTKLMVKNPENIRQTALASLANGQALLNKSYLAELGNYAPQLAINIDSINYGTDVRLCKVERIVLENKQSTLESLTAAYTALGSAGYTVFLLLKSNGQETDVYLGVRGLPKKVMGSEAGKLLDQVFKGHFSGSQLTFKTSNEVEKLFFSLSQTQENLSPSITAVTGVPSISVEEREHFMQGLEKFIDAAEGKAYSAVILAEPVGTQQLNLIQKGYEGVATQLSPLLKQNLAFGENDSESVGLTIGESIGTSFSESLSLTETKGTNKSVTQTETFGTNKSETNAHSSGTSSLTPMSKAGFIVLGGILGSAFNKTKSKTTSYSSTTGSSNSIAQGKTTGTSHSSGSTVGQTSSTTDSSNQNQSINNTQGTNRQITLEMTDKGIEQLLKQVDHHLERLSEARRYGAWNTAAYFISDSTFSSRSLASIFLGLMRGKNSSSEDSALTTWNSEKSKLLLRWLANLTHPRLTADLSKNIGIPYLTPATLVSGKEMAIQLSLPRRSTSTVAVLEAKAFGRRIQTSNGELEKAEKVVNLGKIRHLWQETAQEVKLDVEKLSGHIFVTGSTGSGKSNTVYQLLSELNRNDVKFMVIEPAKGEYKNVFGHRDDVNVFGTNPKKTALLRINPFKFPDEVHVLEHIDRLVEIFNVCWPMYAAMPAILKDAMLEAYKASGWNLDKSYNPHNIFPTFADLLAQLEKVIKKSDFSQEVKSNYQGSLITRVKSLTNGLNGQIFSYNEVDNNLLFNENVIIDLSRVGSQETKSLIMGLLVMRLNEHRQNENCGMNQKLKHITVLEEAHNILKRTSTEQSSEGANVAGKAVEMLSNAIAELRTYGEGFIIADQSPSAVDISAIRNTNTKIIMRLPDEEDRCLAGKAAGVTDEQLEEITRLPKGVAVVYQNDWLEPILCQVAHFNAKEVLFLEPDNQHLALNNALSVKNQFKENMARLLFKEKLENTPNIDLKSIAKGIEQSTLPADYKCYFSEVINLIEQGQTPLLLQQERDYLIDLYQRLIKQDIQEVLPELSSDLQKYLA